MLERPIDQLANGVLVQLWHKYIPFIGAISMRVPFLWNQLDFLFINLSNMFSYMRNIYLCAWSNFSTLCSPHGLTLIYSVVSLSFSFGVKLFSLLNTYSVFINRQIVFVNWTHAFQIVQCNSCYMGMACAFEVVDGILRLVDMKSNYFNIPNKVCREQRLEKTLIAVKWMRWYTKCCILL